MKVFMDTNVLMDVLSQREPFYQDAVQIWSLADTGKVQGLISAASVLNVFYLVRRFKDSRAAHEAVRLLLSSFTVVGCDDYIIKQAIGIGWKDFEGAVQYCSARHAEAACILTRDNAHFAQSDLPVLDPHDFLTGQFMQ